MKISFYVPTTAAIRGGYSQAGRVELDVDPGQLSQADRDLLAAAVSYDGRVNGFASRGGSLHSVEAPAPTVDGLVHGLRAAWSKAESATAERIQKEADELELTEREDAAALAEKRLRGVRGRWEVDHGKGWRVLNYAKGRESELRTRNSPEWAAWLKEIETTNRVERAEEKVGELKAKLDSTWADRRRLAEFLAEIPQDALRGTLKRIAGNEEAISLLAEQIESASPVTIFVEEEAEEEGEE